MDLFASLISDPRADHIVLAKYIVIVLSLLFIPYISVVFGSVLFSLGFSYRGLSEKNPLFMRFSSDIVNKMLGRTGPALVLGILPLFTMIISYSQLLYGTVVKIDQYLFVTLILVVISLLTSYFYRNTFKTREESMATHLAAGLVALGALSVAVFAYVASVTVLMFPEKWPLISTAIPLTFDWNMVARFAHFMFLAKAITGAAILFFFFNWSGGLDFDDEIYREYAQRFAAGITITFTIVQTLFLVWYVVTIPEMAKSSEVYYVAVFASVILWAIALLCYFMLANNNSRHGSTVFGLFLALVLVLLVDESLARNNALAYQNYHLDQVAAQVEANIEAMSAREEGGEAAALMAQGEQVYTAKCSFCHLFDQQMVGPAYKDIIGKYEGDKEGLKEFINNPRPVEPEKYGGAPMPPPGLSPEELEAVAVYIIEKSKE